MKQVINKEKGQHEDSVFRQELSKNIVTAVASPLNGPFLSGSPLTLQEPFNGSNVISVQDWLLQIAEGKILPLRLFKEIDLAPVQNGEVLDPLVSPFFDKKTIMDLRSLMVESGFIKHDQITDLSTTIALFVAESSTKALDDFQKLFDEKYFNYLKGEEVKVAGYNLIELATLLKEKGV